MAEAELFQPRRFRTAVQPPPLTHDGAPAEAVAASALLARRPGAEA